MSISGISSNYNTYNSSMVQNLKSSGTNDTSSLSAEKTPDDMLNYYKEKYSNLNFTAGYNTKGAGSSGLGNVIMHPSLLKKMAADPEFAAKAENNIKYIPQAEEWKKNMCASKGMNLVSSGCFVDEDGNIAGSWSYVETANGNDNEKKEQLEQLREKYSSEKAALDKLMETRSEQRKQYEETVQFYQNSLTSSNFAPARSNITPVVTKFDKLI